MNLTLGTLAELKAHLLAPALRSATDYDVPIAALGSGVAAMFERRCNRKFGRVVGDTFECSADRAHVSLPRYPVEAVTKIELRETLAGAFVEQPLGDTVLNLSAGSGLVYLAGQLGDTSMRLRLTYSGGFWLDESGDFTPDTGRAFKQGRVVLAQGDESKAIVFGQPFDAEDENVNVTISLILPDGQPGSIVNPSLVTKAGFSAVLGMAIPSDGYVLAWTASVVGVSWQGSSELPAGATARPSDLALAWLLQCEHVWQQRDKLGVSIGEKRTTDSAIAKISLLEPVLEILRGYARYTL